ncbi:protein kinase [Promicromonospora sp. NPDC019610]|uniref:protein kinase domain-containing protein n=1 Tax=Promicromonospora sp. NPDC019610 TaxID=3364405 RepID=UPI00378D0627
MLLQARQEVGDQLAEVVAGDDLGQPVGGPDAESFHGSILTSTSGRPPRRDTLPGVRHNCLFDAAIDGGTVRCCTTRPHEGRRPYRNRQPCAPANHAPSDRSASATGSAAAAWETSTSGPPDEVSRSPSKLIRGAQLDDDEFRTRFRREARAAAKVRSRFIANLVDADADADLPWLATEYVAGPTLSQELAAHGPLPEADVLNLVAGVAEALYEIHRAGLVHRDVKPANVILGPDGPRLIDLGVVAAIDATRLTLTGQPVGTPMYMAPEQATGSRATSAADVWALGALAYYAATGHHLFEGDHPAVVLYRVSAEDPSYADSPAYLRPFLDALLVKDPERRPSLDAILGSLGVPHPSGTGPTLVTPASGAAGAAASARGPAAGTGPGTAAPGRAGRAPRRRRGRLLLAVGSVAAGALVLAGAGFGLWDSLTEDDAARGDLGQSGTAGPQDPAEQSPGGSTSPGTGTPTTGPTTEPAADGDGSARDPWAPGTAQRLGPESCWLADVAGIHGRQVTLAVRCDQTGSATWGHPVPKQWLRLNAVGRDGTVKEARVEDATAQDTFWTQGPLQDTSAVRLIVTLPDVGPLAAVEVRHKDGYGAYWAATP